MSDLTMFIALRTLTSYVMSVGATHVDTIQFAMFLIMTAATVWFFKQAKAAERWLMIEFSLITIAGRL